MLDGTFMVGGVGSGKMTVTVKLATPTFPSLSVAVHVTVLVPIGRSVFHAGEQLTEARDEIGIKFPLLSHTGRLGLVNVKPELPVVPSSDLEVPSHKVTDEFIPE